MKRSGRPCKTTSRTDRKIRRLLKANPFWTSKYLKRLVPELAEVSVRTICHRVNKESTFLQFGSYSSHVRRQLAHHQRIYVTFKPRSSTLLLLWFGRAFSVRVEVVSISCLRPNNECHTLYRCFG